MAKATLAGPLMLPTSGTCAAALTRSLVRTVAPSSFAALFRSCSAWARSESSCVFWASIACARCDLNLPSTFALICSGFLQAAGPGRSLYRIRQALRGRCAFLLFDGRLDLGLDLIQRLNPSTLLVFNADDMEAVAGADNVGWLAPGRV